MKFNSGVTPITVFTKPQDCGGRCLYCPTINNIPKGYLKRARDLEITNQFSPIEQVSHWLSKLKARGRIANKLEVVILGGSFLAHTNEYINLFLQGIYSAVDGVHPVSSELKDYIIRHHHSNDRRIIGITIEARPDQITEEAVRSLFAYGITKIELGVQTLDEDVLLLNRRGHGVEEVRRATHIIKNSGIKVGYHMLLGMPGATPESDIHSMLRIFNDTDLIPDHLKIYFCEMFKDEYMDEDLVKMVSSGRWCPYDDVTRKLLMGKILPMVPSHVRISRIGRKFTANDLGVSRKSFQREKYERSFGCRCIRCRQSVVPLGHNGEMILEITNISKNDIYIEAVDSERGSCLGLLRIRLTSADKAIVRELHVYGPECPVGDKGVVQHNGTGSQLLDLAVSVSKKHWGVNCLGVGSGVGVRRYYENKGFELASDGILWKQI